MLILLQVDIQKECFDISMVVFFLEPNRFKKAYQFEWRNGLLEMKSYAVKTENNESPVHKITVFCISLTQFTYTTLQFKQVKRN